MDEEFKDDLQSKELECQDTTTAISNREEFEKNLSNIWGYSEIGLQAKQAAMAMLSTKTGMYARVPIMCKAEDCPYAKSCSLLNYNLAPYGEPCPVETTLIEKSYAGYDNDLQLETYTDKVLVSELINYDVMIERAKGLITSSGELIEEVFAGTNEQGDVYTTPEVSKNIELLERLTKKRADVYSLLQATRKDKKGNKGGEGESLTSVLSSMLNNEDSFIVEQRPEEFIDVDTSTNDGK